MNNISKKTEHVDWRAIIRKYAKPDSRRSVWQLLNTLVPYFALFYLSMRALEISFWLTLP
jgi:omega-6 fatty acid desaturase (delta-12 desaturase)